MKMNANPCDPGAEDDVHPGGIRSWKIRLALLLTALLLLAGIIYGVSPDAASSACHGLDPMKVKFGLGIFGCIAFLWLTEALPLTITALLVPLLGCAFGMMNVKGSLEGFADPLIFLFFGGFAMAESLEDHSRPQRV